MNYDPSFAADAASDPQVSNPVGMTGYDHMSINAGDFEALLRWYIQVLGLEIEAACEVPALDGKRLAYLALNGTRVVEIVAADPNGAGHRADATFAQHFGRTGFGHLCFAAESVDATLAKLEARGAKVFVAAETYPLDGTVYERRVGFVQDPEGNVIEFGEPLQEVA